MLRRQCKWKYKRVCVLPIRVVKYNVSSVGPEKNEGPSLISLKRFTLETFRIVHQPCPLARREAPAEDRRPDGQGANLDRRLVPYHGKCKRIQSRIEFIYLFIYLYIYIYIYMYGTRSFLRRRAEVGYWVNV